MKIASYKIQAARVPYDQAITGTHVILRLRSDKPPQEIDTLERVKEIYERQQLPKTA